MSSPKEKRIAIACVALASAALAGAAGVGLLRDFGPRWALKLNPPAIAKTSAALAEEWSEAIAAGKEAKAIAIAARIAPESESFEMPRPEYLGILCDFRVRLGFLTDPFNFADYARWKSLADAKKLALEIGGSPAKMLEAVMGKVKSQEAGKPWQTPLSAMDCWRDGAGTAEDRARLLCAIASQAGYGSRIIGLPKERGSLLRSVCHLQKGAESWLADTESGVAIQAPWPLDSNAAAALSKGWSPDSIAALKGPLVIFAPSEAQDFRNANILLYERLKASGAKGLPSFPSTPQASYDALSAGKAPQDFASYWHLPFLALKSIKGDPAGWLLDSGR